MPTLAWNGTLVQESYYTAANAMLQLVANDSDSDGDERAMLSVMSTERIQAEWGFGKIINLFSYLDYSKNLKLLKTSVAQSLQVGNLLTNMHTCLYGSIISQATGLDPPSLEDYMSRNF